ncbi:MAG: response regulator transcription factor [Acidobacteria bacterium]|nr:response regulator transcription factor [Acidobacteriota bacterium]
MSTARDAAAHASILLVDDDSELGVLMSEYFADRGCVLDAVADGEQGLRRIFADRYDLLILDVMLPGLDEFEVLTQLRRRSDLPVIMLTARRGLRSRLAGLAHGADDYLQKPFAPDELVARVAAVLRRARHTVHDASPVAVGHVRIDARTREASVGRNRVALTTTEFDILDLLMRSAGRVVSRDEIAAVLYHRSKAPLERTVDVHVSHLRKKIEQPGRPLIRTIRGVGYLFMRER